jgi:RNA methyltransferase, TrmH family
VRRLRRLAARRNDRWDERLFVVEGAKVLAEAVESGARVLTVFVDPQRMGPVEREVVDRAGAEVLDVQPGVLERACDAVHGPPVAALVEMIDVPLARLRQTPEQLILVCVGLQDPGNAGAIIRSAGAAGSTAVVLCSGSVDMYNPKAVRSTAGALFHVPVVAGAGPEEVLLELGGWGVKRMATVTVGGRDYSEVDLTEPTALVLGNEGQGLPADLVARSDERVTIPTSGSAESLNVAMAATLLSFEAARQRRVRNL